MKAFRAMNNKTLKNGKNTMNECGIILIADDTPVMRKACRRALERSGHSVIMAKDGDEALEIVRTEDFDVALLDIKMPGPGGIKVLETIKAEKPLVEVIMMTAHATEGIAEETAKIGAVGFLTKPFSDVKILVDTINQAVQRKRLKENAQNGKPPDVELFLVEEGFIDESQLKRARDLADEWKTTLPKALIMMGALTETDLDLVLAKALNMVFVRLSADEIDLKAVRMAPAWLARKHRLVPFLIEGRTLHVAVDDPFDHKGTDILQGITGYTVVPAKGNEKEIEEVIQVFYSSNLYSMEELISNTRNGDGDQAVAFFEIIERAKMHSINTVEFERCERGWKFTVEGIIEDPGKEAKHATKTNEGIPNRERQEQ